MKKAKYGLLALAGIVVVAALALPASADTSVWLHEGEPLEESVELAPAGGEVVEVGGSVLVCQSSATIATEGGSTAGIAYDVDASSCSGVAGPLAGCEVDAVTSKGLPWNVAVNTSDLTVEEVQIVYWLEEPCPIGEIRVTFPELTLAPDEPSAISLFYFSEEGTAEVDGKEAAISYSGSLNLPEEEAGTYGIG